MLGRFDEAAQTYEKWSTTSHANGAYTNEEKTNRGFFLERLGRSITKRTRPTRPSPPTRR
jgi:hypothetical protein